MGWRTASNHELNSANISPCAMRRTDSSQCVTRLHLALVLRHFDDIVIRLIRVGYTETSVDRVERVTEARDGRWHPEFRIVNGALDDTGPEISVEMDDRDVARPLHCVEMGIGKQESIAHRERITT